MGITGCTVPVSSLLTWLETEIFILEDEIQKGLNPNSDYSNQLVRSVVLHKALLLSKLQRAFDLRIGFDEHTKLINLIANQVVYK